MKEELEKEKELRLAAEKQVAELTKQAKVDNGHDYHCRTGGEKP